MVVLAGPNTGSDLPYGLPPPPTYRLCLSLSIPTPISLQQKKQRNLDFFYFIFYFIIMCVPNPLIVFVRLTCPDCLFPIPKILFERIEEETSESVSRPNAAPE